MILSFCILIFVCILSLTYMYLGGRGESSQPGGSHFERGNRARGRGQGHPPWLSGKEIGLYYRDKAKAKAKQKESRVKLPLHVQEKIKNVLENSKDYYDKLYNNAYAEVTYGTLENKYIHIHDSQFKRKFMNMVSGNIQENLAKALMVKSKLERDTELDSKLLAEYKAKQSLQKYMDMIKVRSKLPSYKKRSEILELINENQVIVISGETGKFILFKIIIFYLKLIINNIIPFKQYIYIYVIIYLFNACILYVLICF